MAPKFIYFLSLILISIALLTSSSPGSISDVSMKPLMKSEMRRLTGGFEICAVCTCCGGPKRVCIASPCCYAINCNIPNRPFGVCAFTPKACNCIGCHI